MLSPQPVFLAMAESRVSHVMEDAWTVEQLTVDNPRQGENFKKLLPLLHLILGRIERNIHFCSTGRRDEAVKIFRSGKTSLDNLRLQSALDQMTAEEQTLLKAREKQLAERGRFALVMFIAGCAFFMAFFAGALWLINREIKFREISQKNLQVEEHRLFQYLEAVPLGIFVADKDGKPYYANQRAREILGRGLVAEASSQTLSQVYQAYRAGTQEIYPSNQTPMGLALQGKKTTLEDLDIHRPDGTVVPLQIWGTPLFNPAGGVQYAMTVFGDITERRQLEEMKHSLISVVSHQLKTPVGEINGYIENLLDGIAGELGKKQKEYLLDMREIGMDNFRLISDLLNISKIERGLISAEPRKVSLRQTVDWAMRDYEKTLQRKGLSLSLEGLDEKLEVMADQDKLIETLRNLINNAIKFTDKGGITLKAEKKEAFIHLEIRDTGSGISDSSLAQLFSRKKVLGAEASRAGAGLGLYVAKYFMKLQGGDITATTEKGKGSCFTLIIPSA
jgi:PAS domain S-box-containing protein